MIERKKGRKEGIKKRKEKERKRRKGRREGRRKEGREVKERPPTKISLSPFDAGVYICGCK